MLPFRKSCFVVCCGTCTHVMLLFHWPLLILLGKGMTVSQYFSLFDRSITMFFAATICSSFCLSEILVWASHVSFWGLLYVPSLSVLHDHFFFSSVSEKWSWKFPLFALEQSLQVDWNYHTCRKKLASYCEVKYEKKY